MSVESCSLSNNFETLPLAIRLLFTLYRIFMHLGLVPPGNLLEWKWLIVWPMCLRYVYLMYTSYVPCVCMRTLLKTKQTIEKTSNFKEFFLNTRTRLRQNFNAVAWFVLGLFRQLSTKKTVKVFSYKTPANNWKNTKLSRNTSEHGEEPQPKFQCRSLLRS